MKTITSSDNKEFRHFLSLTESKGIRASGLCLLSGEKLIRELLPKLEVDCEITNPKLGSLSNHPQVQLSTDLFNEIDVLGTHFNLFVVKIPKMEAMTFDGTPSGLEVYLPLQDPLNLGAAIRSSLAFGAQKIILTQESANPFLPKATKSSAGTSLVAPLFRGPSISELSGECFALDAKGDDLATTKFPKNLRLVVGEEGRGLPGTLKAKKICIPMNKGVESLNAMASLSIVLYELARQRNQK